MLTFPVAQCKMMASASGNELDAQAPPEGGSAQSISRGNGEPVTQNFMTSTALALADMQKRLAEQTAKLEAAEAKIEASQNRGSPLTPEQRCARAPESFDGTGDLELWCVRMGRYLDAQGLTDEATRVRVSLNYLEGSAADWITVLSREDTLPVTMAALKSTLEGAFAKVDIERNARAELKALKQGTSSVEDKVRVISISLQKLGAQARPFLGWLTIFWVSKCFTPCRAYSAIISFWYLYRFLDSHPKYGQPPKKWSGLCTKLLQAYADDTHLAVLHRLLVWTAGPSRRSAAC